MKLKLNILGRNDTVTILCLLHTTRGAWYCAVITSDISTSIIYYYYQMSNHLIMFKSLDFLTNNNLLVILFQLMNTWGGMEINMLIIFEVHNKIRQKVERFPHIQWLPLPTLHTRTAHLFSMMNLWFYIIFSQSPYWIAGFIPDCVYPMTFTKYIIKCIQHFNTVQNNFTVLNTTRCSLPPFFLNNGNHWTFYVMSPFLQSHRVGTLQHAEVRLVFFLTWQYHFKVLFIFSFFFVVLSSFVFSTG